MKNSISISSSMIKSCRREVLWLIDLALISISHKTEVRSVWQPVVLWLATRVQGRLGLTHVTSPLLFWFHLPPSNLCLLLSCIDGINCDSPTSIIPPPCHMIYPPPPLYKINGNLAPFTPINPNCEYFLLSLPHNAIKRTILPLTHPLGSFTTSQLLSSTLMTVLH